MKQNVLSKLTLAAFCTAMLVAGGCSTNNTGASHRPIIDGRMDSQYEADLRECREIASQRDYFNNQNKQNTVVGAAAGGILSRNPISGAILGAAAAATGSALWTRGERKNIVINCMAGRGYKTLESTGS